MHKVIFMRYQFISHILSGAWMISPAVAAVEQQLLQGLLSGLNFERGDEPESTRPYQVSAGSQSSTGSEKMVSIISMRGTILKHDAECGPVGTRTLASRLSMADADPNVSAHVLICESGGGMAAAVPELTEVISNLKKPIVAWVDGMACSAAMYIISYCSEIIASRENDMIGCIGTMIQFQGFPKFGTGESGLITARIYASGSNEKNRDYEEALEGKFELVRSELLDPINDKFVADIKANRPNCKPEHLSGKTFFASQVVGTLIDSIGSLESAITRAVELAGGIEESNRDTSNQHHHNNMEFQHLNAIESVCGLVVEEGAASLNTEQLSDIETALAAGSVATTERDQIRQQLSEKENTIAQQSGRITELEAALEKKPRPAAAPATAVPVASAEKSPYEVCTEHLNNFS